MIMAY